MKTIMKTLAVSLGFFIPVSTFMTNIVLAMLLILSARWSYVKQFPALLRQFSPLKGILLFLGVIGLGCLYSIGTHAEIMYSLKKSGKLLAPFILLPLFFEKEWRIKAYWAFISAVALTVILAWFHHQEWYFFPKALFHVHPDRSEVFKDSLYTAFIVAMGTFVAAQLTKEYQGRIKWLIGLSVFVAFSTYTVFWVNSGRTGQLILVSLWCLFCYNAWRFKGLCVGATLLAIILTVAWNTPTSRFSFLWKEVFTAIQPKIDMLISTPKNITTHSSYPLIASSENGLKNSMTDETKTTPRIMGSTEIRLSIWKESLKMLIQRPWFGWGTGSFQQLVAEANKAQEGLVDPAVARNPHNQYLNIAIQQGLLGLGACLFLFMALLKISWILPRVESGILQGILIAMAIGCLGNSWLSDFTSGYLFIWLVSITVASGYQKTTQGHVHVSSV
ncbi:MAG: hypothetical protein RLZ35_630 [Pseudomonadota bacterium]